MKKLFQVILGIASVSLIACGAELTDEQIADAIKAAAKPSEVGMLNFKKGQTWKSTQVATTKQNLPMKLEGGKLQYCDPADVATGPACNSPVTGQLKVAKTESQAWVLGKSVVASTALPGFAVQETSTVTDETQIFYAKSGTSSTFVPTESKLTRVYTLAEYNHFVTLLDGETDASKGTALYPSNPASGRVYTNDAGWSWAVSGSTTAAIGGKVVRVATVEMSTNRLFPVEKIAAECVKKNVAGATVWLNSICGGALVVEESITMQLYNDLAVSYKLRRVSLNITDTVARPSGAAAFNGYPSGVPDDNIVILFNQTIEEQEITLTDVTY